MDIYAIRVSGDKQQYKVWLSNGQEIPERHDDAIVYREASPHVSLQFSRPLFDGKQSERFRIVVEPAAFTNLAREMMKANPEAAIRAFGRAMQDVQILVPSAN